MKRRLRELYVYNTRIRMHTISTAAADDDDALESRETKA